MRFIILDSGFKEGIDLFDVKYVHIFEEQKTSADLTQAVGRATRSCGQKGLEFIPNEGWKLHVYQYFSVDENENRLFDTYLRLMGRDMNELEIRQIVEKMTILSSVDHDLNYNINMFGGEGQTLFGCNKGKCGKRSTKSIPFSLVLLQKVFKRNKKLPKGYKALTTQEKRRIFCDELKNNPVYCKTVNELYQPKEKDIHRLHFIQFQKKIETLFKKFKYPPLTIENKCTSSNTESPQSNDRIAKLTESQSFISHYFTPQRNMKGMLIWHSVGTGKTCTAISAKSYMFEKQDYHVLWVTRSTLKADIWKNMFEKVCDHIIREKIEEGQSVPVNPEKIKKFVSKRFLPPMSYKQFSNTLKGKNKFANTLLQHNGETDILKKTLIIIDEAHKLYSKDLASTEKPDMDAIQETIQKSYKVSGKDSCKVLLMTATPIADDTTELFQLLNIILPTEKHLPIHMDDFRAQYLDTTTNEFTTEGQKQFQNKIKGAISYLDRRHDPRTFAQAIFHKIPVEISKQDTTIEYCLEKAEESRKRCYDDTASDPDNIKEKYENNMRDAMNELNNLDKQILNQQELIKTIKDKRSERALNIKEYIYDLKKERTNTKNYVKRLKTEFNTDMKIITKQHKECERKNKIEIKQCEKKATSAENQRDSLRYLCKV